jgi:serine/threonine protein kinase
MSEAEQRSPTLVGSLLQGAYQVTRVIGEGAMGTVYEAVQTRLDKRVAVKVLARDLADNPEALARFEREIQVTAKLAHPNIVQVSDFGRVPTGEPYLVMEFLEGEDLEQRLARVTRLPLDRTLHITRQMASALAVTHAAGIVHRDLKPANVFLVRVPGDPEFVKLVDFGVSKVLKASTTKLTRAQMVVGTPEYMAPEQAAGKVDEIDHRSDQWSFACIVWRTLVGQQPFVGADVNAVLHQVMNGEPPALGAGAAHLLPRDIELVLRRALSKRQQDRFPTIAAFARTVEGAAAARLASPRGPQAALTPPPRETRAAPAPRRTGAWMLLALLGAAVIAGAALLIREDGLSLLPRTTAPAAAAPRAKDKPTVEPLGTGAALKGRERHHRRTMPESDE